MGGMQMGVNPVTSVVDGNGRMHQMDNVFCSDGTVFAISGGSNPTNTITAVALRTARGIHRQALPPISRGRLRSSWVNGLAA
jgi:choline dehydrogenase-like flavoprotein